jgi:hypothetical protein
VDRDRLERVLDGKSDPENLHALNEGEDKAPEAAAQPVRAVKAAA